MSGELPEYLKNLETLLSTKKDLTLSTIGFGSMFTPTPGDKLGVLLVSTHVHQFTGYSKVSHGILTELAKQPWLELTHYGIQKFHDLSSTYTQYPPGVEVVDVVSLEKPVQQGFGYNMLPDVIRRKKPKVVILYNDMAVVAHYIEAIRKSGIPRNFKIWVYCDQV